MIDKRRGELLFLVPPGVHHLACIGIAGPDVKDLDPDQVILIANQSSGTSRLKIEGSPL
jgi:hypothetical protein